ncbi:MAG TPA: SDR family oxidoreductase [Acidimicrobiales bacterium]|jgi:NAD(P)-dependent dehydrogenase (short-subunit alcohol dehydrogenase family)|nr:SDR family oxidoreductase [Acidimicrobiales bacterium]
MSAGAARAGGGGLEGRTALVTGGGSGIGLATAARFARDGAQVTICGRTEVKLAAAVAAIDRAAAEGGPGETATPSARYVVADVTVEPQIEAAVAVAAEPTGKLDILFACAGGSHHMGPLLDAEAEGVRATVDLNLVGSFLSLKHAGRAMRETGGGSIVLMSSGAGHFPHRWLWAYGMSKAGIESLCAYAAEELGETGIRVNAVQPGIIDDELMSFITAGGPLLDDYLAQMPVARLGTVDDVATAVRFLAGPESGWITGECLAVDGGHHLRRGADYSLLFGG